MELFHINMFNPPLESGVVTSQWNEQLISPNLVLKRLEQFFLATFLWIVRDENAWSYINSSQLLLFKGRGSFFQKRKHCGIRLLNNSEVQKMGIDRIVCIGFQLQVNGVCKIINLPVEVGENDSNGSRKLTGISSMVESPRVHKWDPGGLTRDEWNPNGTKRNENIQESDHTSAMECHERRMYHYHQIWSEMQSDFLPNFILCNTTQRFIRSSKTVPVQKPSILSAKASFYCGTQDLNSAHQSFVRLHNEFFGIPHMFSIVRLLGSRSLPWLIRALLDHISNKITLLEPMITGLQGSMPKSIGLLPFDGGVTGCVRLVKEHLNWETKSELKAEVLHGIKEIGSVLYWMGLLDIVLRETDTMKFMQTVPWLGLFPGADGQILTSQDGGDSPVVSLFKSTAAAVMCWHLSIMIRQWDPGQLTCSMTVTAYGYHGNVFFEFLHSLSFLFDRGSSSVSCIAWSSCWKLWDPGGRLLLMLGYHCPIQQMKVLELSPVMHEDVEVLTKGKQHPSHEPRESLGNFLKSHLEVKVNLLGGSIDRDPTDDSANEGQSGKITEVYRRGEWKPINWGPQNHSMNSA